MKKRDFKFSEKYAVWQNHQKRCWRCREPLRLIETSVDHFVPEKLIGDQRLNEIIAHYSLRQDFNIDDFENWLPCHRHCNEEKGSTFTLLPAHDAIFRQLQTKKLAAKKTHLRIMEDVNKDKLFAKITSALEANKIQLGDLQSLIADLSNGAFLPDQMAMPAMIHMDSGYWLHEDDIIAQGQCECGESHCVGSNSTVYCYFHASLPPWVVKTHLYWKCYDEMVSCPRCKNSHKRGHVGKDGVCSKSYTNQSLQVDD